ncbi:hypothetical protein VP01_4498g2 [Puccinia sorghi]|uniref:CxC1-like cysteine cluster associated with KDZ transposases domain-containing protein n=1 Tax=Puccinia sorghi TaxID=27349 RepID=A0A0L6UP61_9BASI|nr:hypothetical protein VP01_4498g2 [Puccinia sorghi]
MPDAIQIFSCGYLASTPVYLQTAFSLRLLNLYHLLWNLSNATTTSFGEVLRQCNESFSVRLCSKNSIQPRRLALNLSSSIKVYQLLQDLLAQQTCPECFGTAIPTLTPQAGLQNPPHSNGCIYSDSLASSKENPATDHCSTQHKSADDKRNESTWNSCDNTGLMGACCQHDSLIYFCNIC